MLRQLTVWKIIKMSSKPRCFYLYRNLKLTFNFNHTSIVIIINKVILQNKTNNIINKQNKPATVK